MSYMAAAVCAVLCVFAVGIVSRQTLKGCGQEERKDDVVFSLCTDTSFCSGSQARLFLSLRETKKQTDSNQETLF